MANITFKAGRLLSDPETRQLRPDQRPGQITVETLDELIYVFTFKLSSGDDLALELMLTHGDATFHHIQQQGQVIALKLASSGSKHFFWLQDPSVDAAALVARLNQLIESGCSLNDHAPSLKVPKLVGAAPDPPMQPPTSINDYARKLVNLFSTFGGSKLDPSKILTTTKIMDSIGQEDLLALQQYFPEGYSVTKQDLRKLVTCTAFQQAVSLMPTISTPEFLAQFGLLDHAGDHPSGFDALVKALLKKHQKD